MTKLSEIIGHLKWKILRILYGKSVGKQIAKLVNFAHEYNANGRSVGKHWQNFLGYKLIYLRFKYGKRAVDEICNKIAEGIKEEKALYLFSIDEVGSEDDENNLIKEFKTKGFPLSRNASIEREDNKKKIIDGEKIYIIEKGDGKLKISRDLLSHRIPNNQEIKRLIDSKYPNAALDFKAYMIRK